MNAVIAVLALCTIAGIAIYMLLIRPFVVPLTQRIPHERKYLPNALTRG